MTRRSTARVTPRLWPYRAVLLFLLLLSGLALAQRPDSFNGVGSSSTTTRDIDIRDGGTLVLLSVFEDDGKTRLDRQAVVKITNLTAQTINWQTTSDLS